MKACTILRDMVISIKIKKNSMFVTNWIPGILLVVITIIFDLLLNAFFQVPLIYDAASLLRYWL